MFYSDDFPQYEGDISPSIQDALEVIRRFFNLNEIRVFKVDENRIAVRVIYSVSLPTRGAMDGIDIREEEPILIIFSLKRFPDLIPAMASDRKDFPTKSLPHLYVSKENQPTGFCLVRNSRHEWFASKTMNDLLVVGEQWLYKAGNGLLVEDNNEFDPTRIEKSSGFHVYKYNFLKEAILTNKRYTDSFPFAILMSDIQKGDGALTYKSNLVVQETERDALLRVLDKYDEAFEKQGVKIMFSILVWDETDNVEKNYSTSFPETYGELKEHFKKYNIDIEAIVGLYISAQLHKRNGIPLIHAIKRPRKIVGYDGDFEFINFLISGAGATDSSIPDDASISCQLHNEPFSSEMARLLSQTPKHFPTMFLGGGSLGSKLIFHEARSGNLNIGVIDGDTFLEHNLARHSLFEDSIGQNKAEAIVQEISSFFKQDSKNFTSFKYDVAFFDINKLEKYDWLVDSTASKQVMNFLVAQSIRKSLKIVRCELVNDGKLGLMCIEGQNRNPRIDDLFYLTCYLATKNKKIKKWRKADQVKKLTNLDIGLGCSSSTTVMADETITFHSSLFLKKLAAERMREPRKNGILYRTILEDGKANTKVFTEFQKIQPFEIYDCKNGTGWQIRLKNGLSRLLINSCKKNDPNETGGTLIGLANYKTRTIHIFDVLQKSKDSKASPTAFTRGIMGLPNRIDKVKVQTGQVVGYIGEWHTHPMNFEGLSVKDLKAVQELSVMNNRIPIPTLSIVVTRSKVLPFVF